jgi:DNA-binding XRE family transcriptional regulator
VAIYFSEAIHPSLIGLGLVKYRSSFAIEPVTAYSLFGDLQMNVQVIERDGQPEYAVLPWDQYQALLRAAGQTDEKPVSATVSTRANLTQLASLRESKGIAGEQMARSVGISPHYLNMIEKGERRPDDAILRALAWHLGIEGWEPQP